MLNINQWKHLGGGRGCREGARTGTESEEEESRLEENMHWICNRNSVERRNWDKGMLRHHLLVLFQCPTHQTIFVFEWICVRVWLTAPQESQAGTWLWPFHLVWLSRSLLVRPLLPFSLSCPLLQLANQPNHCPLLLLPPPSLLGPHP